MINKCDNSRITSAGNNNGNLNRGAENAAGRFFADNNFIVLACLIFIFSYNIHIYPWMMDDAFIFFRYAENFSCGQGYVYNPGERVEGCTSFLWLLILSGAALFKIDLLIFSKIINAVFVILIVKLTAVSHKYIKSMTPAHSAAAAALLSTAGAFTPWLSSGMESVLFSFLIIITYFYSIVAQKPVEYGLSGVLCALLVICRPEGIFLATPVFVFHYITQRGFGGKGFYISLFKFIYVYAPYFAWRYFYYGSFMPNTYYAKIGFNLAQISRGANYLFDYFAAAAFFLILLAPAGHYIFSFKGKDPQTLDINLKLAVLYVFVLLNIVFVTLAGGDFMYGFRFFAHLSAPLAIIAVYALSILFKRSSYFKFAVIVIIVYSLAQFFIHPELYGIAGSSPVEFGRLAGLFLKRNVPPDGLLAINTAGIIPYYSKLKTVDMLGLTDKHIARSDAENFGSGPAGHEKGDGFYILDKKPDIIVMGNFEGSKTPIYRSDIEIFNNPAFKERYRLKVHKIFTAGRKGGGRDNSREIYFYYYEKKSVR